MERRRKAGLRVVRSRALIRVGQAAAVAAAFGIAVAVGVWFLPTVCDHPVRNSMQSDAASLKTAAMLYLRENGSERCPTAEEVKRERFLSPTVNTADVWQTTFRIECNASEAVVVSAGPDLAFDTEDDFEPGGF